MPHAACLEYFIEPLLVDVEAPASVGIAKANGTLIRQHGNRSQSKAKLRGRPQKQCHAVAA